MNTKTTTLTGEVTKSRTLAGSFRVVTIRRGTGTVELTVGINHRPDGGLGWPEVGEEVEVECACHENAARPMAVDYRWKGEAE